MARKVLGRDAAGQQYLSHDGLSVAEMALAQIHIAAAPAPGAAGE